ncbi:MAG: hypothetical protein ACE5ER_04350 [Nitrospinaceae bacterium]
MNTDPSKPQDRRGKHEDSPDPDSRLPKLFAELGSTPLAAALGLTGEQLTGHWCSPCRGIWYGQALEVECPRCGNRKG